MLRAEEYPFFAKFLKWLAKPKVFKDERRTKEWAKFDNDKNVSIECLNNGVHRLTADINGDLAYFIVDYNPNSLYANYFITVFFAYARCYYGQAVSIDDKFAEETQEIALKRLQHYCYIYMK